MQFSVTTVMTAALASLALANPVQLESRQDHSKVSSFSDDLCTNGEQVFEVTGVGARRCIPVSNKRSIKVADKHGCTIKTWSGSNCGGSDFTLPDGDLDCHSVLHAAVEIIC
ncbi:hypothetical protein COL922a_012696 [Colletotrichum nupharicola]|nr:hypothetical protein COL922a_012696 [Colletotrichum nupharicola]